MFDFRFKKDNANPLRAVIPIIGLSFFNSIYVFAHRPASSRRWNGDIQSGQMYKIINVITKYFFHFKIQSKSYRANVLGISLNTSTKLVSGMKYLASGLACPIFRSSGVRDSGEFLSFLSDPLHEIFLLAPGDLHLAAIRHHRIAAILFQKTQHMIHINKV